MKKLGANKGGHIVLVTNVDDFRPISYVHQHKVHTHPSIFKAKGPGQNNESSTKNSLLNFYP